jgi:predicted TIM-barrel fold metal-dependent hydrolase
LTAAFPAEFSPSIKEDFPMIIDFHCQVGPSRDFKGTITPRSIVERMDRRKIDKAVLFPSESNKKLRPYEDVLQALKEFPDRFYGFFGANPREEDVCEMLQMVVEKYGFKGVRLHPTFSGVVADDEDWVYPIAEMARKLKVCMMVHSDTSILASPWQVGMLAMDFPGVPVVMAHMGFVDIISNDGAIEMARRVPNLYLETSGVSAEDKVAQAVREAGAAKVLYGSDMPFNDPAFEMAKIEYANISDNDKRMILGENAKKFFEGLGK